VLTFHRKFRPTEASVIATTLNNIGAAHDKCGHRDEAVSYFKAAVDTLEASDVPGKEGKIAHVRRRLAQLGITGAEGEGAAGAPAARAAGGSNAGAASSSAGSAQDGAGAGANGEGALAPADDVDGEEALPEDREVAE